MEELALPYFHWLPTGRYWATSPLPPQNLIPSYFNLYALGKFISLGIFDQEFSLRRTTSRICIEKYWFTLPWMFDKRCFGTLSLSFSSQKLTYLAVKIDNPRFFTFLVGFPQRKYWLRWPSLSYAPHIVLLSFASEKYVSLGLCAWSPFRGIWSFGCVSRRYDTPWWNLHTT